MAKIPTDKLTEEEKTHVRNLYQEMVEKKKWHKPVDTSCRSQFSDDEMREEQYINYYNGLIDTLRLLFDEEWLKGGCK